MYLKDLCTLTLFPYLSKNQINFFLSWVRRGVVAPSPELEAHVSNIRDQIGI